MFIDDCRNENSAVDVVSNNHFLKKKLLKFYFSKRDVKIMK